VIEILHAKIRYAIFAVSTLIGVLVTLVLKRQFLADRTNGRTYATVSRLSVCLSSSSVSSCIAAKRCIQQKSLL